MNIPKKLLTDMSIPASAKLIYLYLKTFDHCVTVKEIARAVGIGERTAYRSRNVLFEKGWLDWWHYSESSGLVGCNHRLFAKNT